MSIESDAQQDLELDDEEAESVAGGKRKLKPYTHPREHHGRESAGSTIPSSFTASPTGHVVAPDSEGDDGYLTGQ